MATKAKTTTKKQTKTTTAKRPTSKSATTKSVSTKSATAGKKAAPRKRKSISDDDVARQAYILWLERGGNEVDNWLEAERQLR